MPNAVERLRIVLNRAKVVLKSLCKDVLLFLSTDDIRVLMSVHALIVRKPLKKIKVAAQAELLNLLD